MADPARPTVPDADGVPPVNPPPQEVDANGIPVTNDPNTITVVGKKTDDSPAVASQNKPKWGVFDKDGNLALESDSVFELEDSHELNVPRYPLEGGGFQSFNKVDQPVEVHLVLVKGGTQAEKFAFLTKVASITASLDLYSVVTPEQTYSNMNLVRNSKHRSAESGADLLHVELTFQEARISATTAFTNVQVPSGADNVNGGSVQTQTPTANQNPGAKPQ